jgi:8-oxo-dGTP diphosphatase
LVFVVREGTILLIHKKRGLGAGKINGPGGRLEPGETPFACAIREVEEELLITPRGLVRLGELLFQFLDGYRLYCTVFYAQDYDGEPQETEEAAPLFCPVDAIPYPRMWADDALWLPLLLRRQRFRGRFVFDGEVMLEHELEILGAQSFPESLKEPSG